MQNVSFDSLISRSFGLLAKGIGTYLPVSLLMYLPAGALSMWLALSGQAEPATMAGCLGLLALMLLNLVLQQVITAAISYGVFRGLRGEEPSFTDCLRLATSRLVSLIGAALLVSLAVGGGMILLLVPGFIAMVALSVTIPALVVEKRSALDALSRSWNLTSGYRWPIFGVLILVVLATAGVSIVVGIGQFFVGVVLATILQFFFQAIATAFTSVFSAVAYHDLRAVREGLDEDELAAVFD